MAKNIVEIPFTELVERTSELARERVDVRGKVRAIVNDVYTREIPRKEDWSFFLVSSTLTLQQEYNSGTVTATTGATSVVFSSAASMSSSNTGMKLKISGNDYPYDVTFLQTTSLTISPPFSGTTNVSGASYNLYEPFYSLAPDFDRFPKNGGLINFRGSTQEIIPEEAYQDWNPDYSTSTQETPARCRIIGTDTAGNAILEVNPPPKIAKTLRYDYFIKPKVMRETTAGLIGNISASGTTVTGDGNTLFTQANTGDYFRIDAFGTSGDSEWYRIIAINGNSSLTIQTAFGLSGATSANYTICSAPQMPSKMHPAVLYGSLLQLAADQDDPMVQSYNLKLAEVLSDGKRLYKTRIYNQDIHNLGEEYMYRR